MAEMEKILEIDVTCTSALEVEGKKQKIVMVGFDGTVNGRYFTGKVIGSGVDTQKYLKDDAGNFIGGSLSARYMLEGEDYTGEKCRIFVENNVPEKKDGVPIVTTDSTALSFLENIPLISRVESKEGGVIVEIFSSITA